MSFWNLRSMAQGSAVVLCLGAFAPAETLTGSVLNGTTDKPAVGDEVVLLKLGQGMDEAGRTKTDSKGKFSFNLDDNQSPHLVRVIHQGVTYHRMAPPGSVAAEVVVFDVAKKVEGISVAADLMYVQARTGELGITRIFSVNNASQPPRTEMKDQTFEFYLPEGAQIDGASAQTSGGQPVNSAPVPQAEKNRYTFIFPLRPGETRFQLAFRVPYTGSAHIDPKSLYPLEHFVVVMPKTMQFSAAQKDVYQDKALPDKGDAIAKVAANTTAGQQLSFDLNGTGMLQESSSEQASNGGSASSRDARPGGGLGAPIDAPDPLEKYRWYILGGFGAVLAAGAFYISKRPQSEIAAGSLRRKAPTRDITRATTLPAPKHSSLLAALKEELFALEVEHKQGHISQGDYEKSKAALDVTLQRAIKREASN